MVLVFVTVVRVEYSVWLLTLSTSCTEARVVLWSVIDLFLVCGKHCGLFIMLGCTI